jgi:cell division septation protein DedD
MHKLILLVMIVCPACIFFSCSSSEESATNSKTDDEYVFDKVPPEDTYIFESPISSPTDLYIIQIGAFSTKERAESFALLSRSTLQREVIVNYNSEVSFFVVQLAEQFNNREEAENLRDELWKYEEYDDAWILSKKK